MDDVINCAERVAQAVRDARSSDGLPIQPGSLTHAIEQISLALREGGLDLANTVERRFESVFGTRVVDVVARGIHFEVKSGQDLAAALNLDQLTRDASLAI